jgi:hypothetical protein
MSKDRPHYAPDVAQTLRDADPATFEAQERKAVAKLVEAGLIDRLTPEPERRPSAPSPWAKGAGATTAPGIEKEALMPAAEERPVTKAAATPRAWPRTWKLVVIAGAVGLAAPFLSLAIMRSAERTEKAASTAATATTSAAPAPSVTAVPGVTAVVMGAAPPGTAVPSATAGAPLAPAPRKPHGTPAGRRSDMDAGPLPPSRDTAEPAPSRLPTSSPAVDPTATPPQSQIRF